MSTFKVVFWGGVHPDQDRTQAIQGFARRFKLSDRRQLQHLFSGRVVTLKRHLSEADAKRYVTVLKELGLQCRVEPEASNFWGAAANNAERYPSGLAQRKVEAERQPPLIIENKAHVA